MWLILWTMWQQYITVLNTKIKNVVLAQHLIRSIERSKLDLFFVFFFKYQLLFLSCSRRAITGSQILNMSLRLDVKACAFIGFVFIFCFFLFGIKNSLTIGVLQMVYFFKLISNFVEFMWFSPLIFLVIYNLDMKLLDFNKYFALR